MHPRCSSKSGIETDPRSAKRIDSSLNQISNRAALKAEDAEEVSIAAEAIIEARSTGVHLMIRRVQIKETGDNLMTPVPQARHNAPTHTIAAVRDGIFCGRSMLEDAFARNSLPSSKPNEATT
ncbi:MAG: hypothetical protein P8L85_13670 [Rubripirellula sp.]|nr:hypothetical protein [Rubripirellula sp.]